MRSLIAAATLLCLAAPAAAVDTVNLRGEQSPVIGTITGVSKDAVTVNRKVSGDQEVPSNEIESVEFDGEPPAMKLARTAERNGRTDEALEKLDDVLGQIGDNKPLRGEVTFLIARAKARRGEADPDSRADAIAALESFASEYRDHYRYYESQLRLGRLHALAGSAAVAQAVFQRLADSPYADHKMAAEVAAADAKFAAGDMAAAKAGYEAVAGQTPNSAGETSRRLAALLGKAKVETAEGQFDAAIATLEEVIRGTSAEDTGVQAEAYLRQGDAYAAKGGTAKAAVMAYLHVDVIPSLARESASHAEALFRLSTLWPAVGHADRGAEAAARLREMYPGSEWTKKLAG